MQPNRRRTSKPPSSRRVPYAAAKVYAYWVTRNYRDGYKLFASNGILFNHESPRRGETFVTRKITRAVANIVAGKQKKLYLGNLDARRDWGYAPDYVAAIWKILQHDQPGDFVIGTGEAHSVREFLEEAFGYVNMDWQDYVEIDPRYFRPTEVDYLQSAPVQGARAGLGAAHLSIRTWCALWWMPTWSYIGRRRPEKGAGAGKQAWALASLGRPACQHGRLA